MIGAYLVDNRCVKEKHGWEAKRQFLNIVDNEGWKNPGLRDIELQHFHAIHFNDENLTTVTNEVSPFSLCCKKAVLNFPALLDNLPLFE